jgi:hypothetical protein
MSHPLLSEPERFRIDYLAVVAAVAARGSRVERSRPPTSAPTGATPGDEITLTYKDPAFTFTFKREKK